MKVKLIKNCRYYAPPYFFTGKNPEQEVRADIGKKLLATGYFNEVKKPVSNSNKDNKKKGDKDSKGKKETKEPKK